MDLQSDAAATRRPTVVLVGLMGAGKSTVGKVVAASLGRHLVDVDNVIEQQVARSVGELWADGGEAAYRVLERQAVIDALGRKPPVVLAAPGGVIDDPDLVERLGRPDVFVVFLRGDVDTLARRISDDDQERPLVGDDPAAVLREQSRDRNPRYEVLAQATFDVHGRTPEELAHLALEAFSRTARSSQIPLVGPGS